MAIVNLGSIKFNWQGAYNGATAYSVDDVVSYNGASYICTAASTGNLPTDTNFWDQMSSAGTDGTDLTSTLTTQGDIVYRDASGLARLPAGSANQVLQSGGTGANPSWGTVSSDFVKIADGSITSTVSSFSIDGYFTSDYDNYKLIINDLQSNVSSSNSLRLRYNFSGTEQSATNYHFGFRYSGYNTGSTSNHGDGGNTNTAFIQITNDLSSNASETSNVHLTIPNPLDTDSFKFVQYDNSTVYGNGNGILRQTGIGTYRAATTAVSGFTFYFENGNSVVSAKWKLYGLKN